MTRNETILSFIDRNGVGVEIGPSYNPVAPKRDGFKVHIIDHATRAELVAKYNGQAVEVDRIEEVDFVWNGQPYAKLTGRPNSYDWVIASHVIEHSTDLIGFLTNCDALLNDNGVLSLAVPDKRVCFDRFRPITSLARVIDSHLSGNVLHSVGAVAEHFMNETKKGGRVAWEESWRGDYEFCRSIDETLANMREASTAKSYLDVHNWCFVPHSFRLMLADLFDLGFTRLREVHFMPTAGTEFFVAVSRAGSGPRMSRLDMLRAIDSELAATDDAGPLRARIRRFLTCAAAALRVSDRRRP
jgi:predicted SAM-dependent methyltransferase